jgi:hypothetical protein
MRFAVEAEPARPVVVSPAASHRDQIRLRPGQPSVVPPVESALPGVVAEEPDAGRGKRLQDVPFGGGLEVRVARPPVGFDAPGPEQRVKGSGNDGCAMATR